MTTQIPFLPADWRTNLLYDDSFIEQRLAQESDHPLVAELTDWLNAHYLPEKFAKQSESQLENSFIQTLVKKLGWTVIPQISVSVQGKNTRPDWGLLENQAAYDTYYQNENNLSAQLNCITVLLEAKKYSVALDKSAHKYEKSPHFQLLDYLQSGQKRYGFLTNGRLWRLYDLEKISRTKAYLEIDLTAVLALEDAEKQRALTLFCLLFAQQSYVKTGAASSTLENIGREAEQYAYEAEENLKAVIYGTNGENSLFESIGSTLCARNPLIPLNEIYDNGIILLFRLLFIIYFEDKNHSLLAKHPFYHQHGLQTIFDALKDLQPDQFDGFYRIKNLFKILDEGAADIDLPLFNGGLFDPERAPLLDIPKIFNNKALLQILEQLRFKTERNKVLFEHRRDYKNMSVTHLGRIYEGLLEFTFQIADEPVTYLEYRIGNSPEISAYLDRQNLPKTEKQKGFVEIRRQTVPKGNFFLKSANNSRKSSASYYTPSSLSRYLVHAGIDHALSRPDAKPLHELKIIDNACGSGHFLVEALNYLTEIGMARLTEDVNLQKLIHDERTRIHAQIASLNIDDYEPEDAQILKRTLLKRCIYGVDLNPFAVELARLSLWIDTFIFGTPLSFIEHHIQHGNALMGATEADIEVLRKNYQEDNRQGQLDWEDSIQLDFADLNLAANELNALRDTSTADIQHSKHIYKHSIKPKLKTLSFNYSFVSMLDMVSIAGESEKLQQLGGIKAALKIFCEIDPNTHDAAKARRIRQLHAEIEHYQNQYHFFHYEIAFPEAREGFDVIVGNPPWDRTKFTDLDFFPRYHSGYRSMKNLDKQEISFDLLAKPHIRAVYDQARGEMDVANRYYTLRYPLNRGSGDGNLFRFFVERNLGLLVTDGCLNYVLPSALMFEEGSQTLRQHILSQHTLTFFYSLENRLGLFLDVDSRYKFALMQIANVPPTADTVIQSAFYLNDTDEITPQRTIPYPVNLLKQLSPDQWAMMELRDAQDLPILSKCYQKFESLNTNWLNFRRELDTTNDKELFIEKPKAGLLPLVEGKMIWQYSNQHGEAQYWLDRAAFDQKIYSKELSRMARSLGKSKSACQAQNADAVRYDRDYLRLAFRKIASDTNERTLIFALLPKQCGVSDSINISIPKNYVQLETGDVVVLPVSHLRLLFALGWFNSLPVDWIARFMIQLNANKTYLYRLPMPQPNDAEILANADYRRLAENALRLTLANNWEDFAELAPIFDIQRKKLPITANAKDLLRFENDCIVAKLYGITPDEMRHLLKSFKVMQNKRPEYAALFNS